MHHYLIRAGLVFCIGFACLLGISASIDAQRLQSASDAYASALRGTTVHIALRGAHIIVTDGTVTSTASPRERFDILALAYARLAAERNPYFALAGTDPVSLAKRVSELITARDHLASAQSSPAEQLLIKRQLYPISFLQMLGELEDARLALIKYGSDADADRYARALTATSHAYLSEIHSFRSGFEQAVPQTAKRYVTTQEMVDRKSLLASIDALEQSAMHTESLVRERRLCLSGSTRYCTADDLRLPEVHPTNTWSSAKPTGLTLAREISRLLHTAGIPRAAVGPSLVHIATSTCGAQLPNTGNYFELTASETNTSPWGDEVRYVGDIRFIDSTAPENVPYFSYFEEHKVTYVPAGMFTYYACTNSSRDRALALAVRDTLIFAHAQPLSAVVTENKNELRELEHALTSGIATEDSARKYLHAGLELIRRRVLSSAHESRVIDLVLEFNNASAGLDVYVRSIGAIENMNLTLNDRGLGADNAAPFLFYVRSGFLGLFLTSNPSAAPNYSTAFLPNPVPEEGPYLWFSREVKTAAQKALLLRDLKFYFALHTTAL